MQKTPLILLLALIAIVAIVVAMLGVAVCRGDVEVVDAAVDGIAHHQCYNKITLC